MRRHRYLILLVALVSITFVESYARRAVLGLAISDILVTLAALAVFLVVFEGWRERTFALVTAAAGVAFAWVHYLPLGDSVAQYHAAVHHVLMMVFLGFAVIVILTNIFSSRAVTADDILGTICGYLLAGACFANAYALADILVPGSFSVAQESQVLTEWHSRTALFNYFSMVTLTTMGYGDVTPVRAPATAIAMMEAVFGQFYIAIVVAQMVGLRMATSGRAERAPDAARARDADA